MPGKMIIIKIAVPYEGPIRIVVTEYPNCGNQLRSP